MKKNLKSQNLAKKTNSAGKSRSNRTSNRKSAIKEQPVSKASPSAKTTATPTAGAPSSTDAIPPIRAREILASTAPAEAPPKSKKPAKRRLPMAGERKVTALRIPAILLEGDSPAAPAMSGPGARYALTPQPAALAQSPAGGELPEAYGTGRIFLAARDPRWLYASWDFTHEQQRAMNLQSRDGHLVLRVYAGENTTPAIPDVHVHPESKHWFIGVPHPETSYRAEIGCYSSEGSWRALSVSPATFTPPDAPSADTQAEFATIPPQVTFKEVVEAVREIVEHKPSQPLLEAVALAAQTQKQQQKEQDLERQVDLTKGPRKTGEPLPDGRTKAGRPSTRDANEAKGAKARTALPIRIEPGRPWKPEQQQALRRLIHIDSHRRVWLGSIEITELVRRQLEEEIASIAAVEARKMLAGVHAEEIPGLGISSPAGGEMPRPRKFWFKVNAELIVYGATEPDAKVTIAERTIKLRPDGTFSFRFSLPDGRYQLPAAASSADGKEAREARLEFSRSTEYRGRVEPHPQNGELRPPRPEHVR